MALLAKAIEARREGLMCAIMSAAVTVLAAPLRSTERSWLPMPSHRTIRSPQARFWSKVEADASGCLVWRGTRNHDGYGIFKMDQKNLFAHRLAWEARYGSIRTDLEIDHLCRNRPCVNTDHMEVVTHGENIRRGHAWHHWAARQLAKTHCPYGHPYSEANTRRYKNSRFCRICGAMARRRQRGIEG
jgi:hypothetical protein